MKVARPLMLTALAWLWILTGGVGAAVNIYGLLVALPPYPQWMWGALLVSKIGTIAAGVLLLRMRKLAVWVYIVVAAYGWALALGLTDSYTPVPFWRYLISLAVLALYALVIWPHWNKLEPRCYGVGVPTNA